jgi:hypothetical protein
MRFGQLFTIVMHHLMGGMQAQQKHKPKSSKLVFTGQHFSEMFISLLSHVILAKGLERCQEGMKCPSR